MPNEITPSLVSCSVTSEDNEHDAILQILDRKSQATVLSDGKYVPTEVFISQQSFEPTINEWENVPLIFAPEHPIPENYNRSPETELKRIGGKIVGSVRSPRIDRSGTPKVMAKLNISTPEVESLRATGKLDLSTSYWCPIEGGKTAGKVAPHHILLFERDFNGSHAADMGAMFLNQAKGEIKMPTQEEYDGVKKQLDEANAKLVELEKKSQETATLIANKEVETKKSLDDLNIQIKAKDETILAFQTKEKESKWLAYRQSLPPGILHADTEEGKKEKETVIRKEFEESPQEAVMRVLAFKSTEGKPPEGEQHPPNGDNPPNPESKLTVGGFNPKTKEFQK